MGCAHNFLYTELVVNRKLTEQDIHSDETYVLDVPFIKQELANCCGIACLWMVLKYWAEPPESIAVTGIVDCPKDGFSGRELREIAIAHGFNALVYKGSLADIYKNLLATRPVIVMLNRFGSNHYLVVSGYSQDGKLIIDNPLKGKMFIDIRDFMEQWRRARYFSLLVLPRTSIERA